jgi:thiosulfate/3-mercaptopyruvate sulfurtransferase
MQPLLGRWFLLLCTPCLCWALMAAPASAEEGRQGRLVNVAWLQKHLADAVVLDASMTPQHMAGHIPGAVSADLYRYGPNEPSRAVMEKRIQSWGISPGRKVVLYDQGGDMMATRLFYDLYYQGAPASELFILDGGLAQWRAQGGAVTKEPTPPPPVGTFRITAVREEVRVRLPEFLVASGDPVHHALVEALEPSYHYGEQKFFDRAGHVPNAILMPSADFYNADKTFKSPDEIRRLVSYLGIKPEQVVHSHCGGGVAASVPWFALQFMVEHPTVKLYLESQREWLRDDRGLPYWTYSAPRIQRQSAWLDGWNAPMLRAFGVAQLNIVDVRAAEKYAQGHVAFALNVPADTFRSHLGRPEKLAELLGPAGVNPAHEVVIMAESGLTPGAALAFLAFEQLGQKKVSVLMDSVDEWGLRGHGLTKEPTVVGLPTTAKDTTVPVAKYAAQLRPDVLIGDPLATRGAYPKVFVASGKAPPARAPEGQVVQLPYTELLNADGTPKPAKELWKLITQAGVPRHAEVILFADDPAEAAVNYYVFRLMGWPDIKVWAN